MDIRISPNELEAIEQYLKLANSDQLQNQLRHATYSQAALTFIFPAIRKLLDYGTRKNKQWTAQAIQPNYAYRYQAGQDNPRLTFRLIQTYTRALKERLTTYKLALANHRREGVNTRFFEQRGVRYWLFSLPIAEMSETQYQQFCHLIGG